MLSTRDRLKNIAKLVQAKEYPVTIIGSSNTELRSRQGQESGTESGMRLSHRSRFGCNDKKIEVLKLLFPCWTA